MLTRGTVDEVREGVAKAKGVLRNNGGCIGQVDFGIGAKPENVMAALETWTV